MSVMMKSSAVLLVIDAQNLMLHEKGLGARFGVWKHAQQTKMIENTRRAIEKARAATVPIIYIQTFIRREVLAGLGLWREFQEMALEKITKSEQKFQRSIVEDLVPSPEDLVITKYNTMDAFHNTDLDQILRGVRCQTLIISGVATNFCVECTVRSAFNRGYNIIVLKDCVATNTEENQRFALEVMFPLFAKVISVEQLELPICDDPNQYSRAVNDR